MTKTEGNPLVPSYQLRIPAEDISEIMEAVHDILSRGELLLGPFTARLESSFSAKVNRSCCVAVSSGTTALEIILRHIDVRGRRVLVPSNTNYATALAALNAGATVELYDSGLYPDMENLRDAFMVVDVGAGTTDFGLFVVTRRSEDDDVQVFQVPASIQGLMQAGDKVDNLLRAFIAQKESIDTADNAGRMPDRRAR